MILSTLLFCSLCQTKAQEPVSASISWVYPVGTLVHISVPKGTRIGVTWHVFIRNESTKNIKMVWGSSDTIYADPTISFNVPEVSEGQYTVIGAKFFDTTLRLNFPIKVISMPEMDDSDDKKFIKLLEQETK